MSDIEKTHIVRRVIRGDTHRLDCLYACTLHNVERLTDLLVEPDLLF